MADDWFREELSVDMYFVICIIICTLYFMSLTVNLYPHLQILDTNKVILNTVGVTGHPSQLR